MGNAPMPSRRTESSRRAVRWLLPAALIALTPKCFLCLLAYAGLGAALGLGGPEICGASAGSHGLRASLLALAALGIVGLFAGLRRRRNLS
jgi:MYXO-CTERM domain-containing protein